jgi:hypothetical protein
MARSLPLTFELFGPHVFDPCLPPVCGINSLRKRLICLICLDKFSSLLLGKGKRELLAVRVRLSRNTIYYNVQLIENDSRKKALLRRFLFMNWFHVLDILRKRPLCSPYAEGLVGSLNAGDLWQPKSGPLFAVNETMLRCS